MRPLTFSLSLLYATTGLTSRIAGQEGPTVSAVEYEGWRQYHVHCARCHGQDALPNPVAANLLTSLAPGGPAADQATFTQVVRAGREKQGMPAFGKTVTPDQVDAMYAYLRARAEKRIPPGRPKEPVEQAKETTG